VTDSADTTETCQHSQTPGSEQKSRHQLAHVKHPTACRCGTATKQNTSLVWTVSTVNNIKIHYTTRRTRSFHPKDLLATGQFASHDNSATYLSFYQQTYLISFHLINCLNQKYLRFGFPSMTTTTTILLVASVNR